MKKRTAEDMDTSEEQGAPSGTAVAAEALRTGVVPVAAGGHRRQDQPQVPGEDKRLQMGDPDDSPLDNLYVGDNTAGGSSPTPDQNSVDDIGRAYGVQDDDNGELHASSEVLENRDRHRVELEVPKEPGEI